MMGGVWLEGLMKLEDGTDGVKHTFVYRDSTGFIFVDHVLITKHMKNEYNLAIGLHNGKFSLHDHLSWRKVKDMLTSMAQTREIIKR